MTREISRRVFIGGAGTLGLAASSSAASSAAAAARGPNDRVTVGMIGVGARAHQLIDSIRLIDGTEIVAVCDAYQGRVERAIERTAGRARKFSDWRAILSDRSIDAVVVASPDHWHRDHSVAALEAGKDVYCEKPLTYAIDDGLAIAAAVKRSGKILQVGSHGMSSRIQRKAREMIQSGKLGKVTMVRASFSRNSASGAWIYPIPPDASPDTVDWEMFLGSAPRKPFSLERFFRWRCYKDYSGGIATDLFVHLATTIHYLMGAKAPAEVVAMGDLYLRRESRDVPDTLNAVLRYPEGFTVTLGSTFNNASAGFEFQFMGTEGSLSIGGSGLEFSPEIKREDNAWIVRSWPRKLEEAYYRDEEIRRAERPDTQPPRVLTTAEQYRETGIGATTQHLENFFASVRTRKQPEEDVWAGHRAAACAHLINAAARTGAMTKWDFQNDRQA